MNRISSYQKDRFYASAAWKKLRDYKLQMCPDCECPVCLEYGYSLPASEVHHIVDIDQDWSLRLTYSNLMSCTHDHHSRLTMQSLNVARDKERKNKRFDAVTERLLKAVTDTGGRGDSLVTN